MIEADAIVTYPVKQLLEELKHDQHAGFNRVEASLAGKADKMDVARMEVRLEQHGAEIAELQSGKADRDAVSDLQQWKHGAEVKNEHKATLTTSAKWLIGALGTALLILATILGPYLANHL